MNGEPQAELDDQSTRAPRRRRRPGENRERLIQAGIEAFGWLGYHGASTASIGQHAEVQQPHIYANFTTKQALFLACVRRMRDEWLSGAAWSASQAGAADTPPPPAPPVELAATAPLVESPASVESTRHANAQLPSLVSQYAAHRFATDLRLAYARLLLQAITVSNDLSDPQLDALLLELRSGLGEDYLQTQLAQAAGSLLLRRESSL